MQSRFMATMAGLACAEAIGLQAQHAVAGTFTPITDITGGGPWQLLPGQWGAGTAMALCLAESLLQVNGFSADNQMAAYRRWWRRGYMSCTGRCFGAASETLRAIEYAERHDQPVSGSHDIFTAGADCMARLAPVVLFYHNQPHQLAAKAESSALPTHAALESVECCRLLAAMLDKALRGDDKQGILQGHGVSGLCSLDVHRLSRGDYRNKPVKAVSANHFAPENLEAALWCFANTESFAEAVLAAANLGGYAAAASAICGQLAGAYYGFDAIPPAWLETLAWRDKILAVSEALYQRHQSECAMLQQLQQYDITDVRYSFALATAARAASTAHCRIRTAEAAALLQEAGVSQLLRLPQQLPDKTTLDKQHRLWCRAVIRAGDARAMNVSHGTAAMLINSFLHAGIILPQQADADFMDAMHPPLTRPLLAVLDDNHWLEETAIAENNQGLDEQGYENIIRQLRLVMAGQGLWKLANLAGR